MGVGTPLLAIYDGTISYIDPVGTGECGKTLEFTVKRLTSSFNLFRVRVYALDSDRGSSPLTPVNVTMYHRKTGTTTWSAKAMTASTDYWYEVDMKTLYPAFTAVDIMVRAESGIPLSGQVYHDNYKYGWAPPYKYRPATPEDNQSKAYSGFFYW